jgi:alpha-beta hydrolase superfamily lysophospholipase
MTLKSVKRKIHTYRHQSARNRGYRPFPLGWSGHVSMKFWNRTPSLEDVLFDWRSKSDWEERKNKPKKKK